MPRLISSTARPHLRFQPCHNHAEMQLWSAASLPGFSTRYELIHFRLFPSRQLCFDIVQVLASAAIGLVASKLYVGGLCFTLSHTLACHWVFVSASLSITLGVGYSIIDFVRLPQEKPHRSSDFDEFFLKTSVMVSTLLTGIWVTSGCLIAKQFVSFTHENDKPTEAGEQDHHYIVTVLGIIAIVWCFATAIAWVSSTFT